MISQPEQIPWSELDARRTERWAAPAHYLRRASVRIITRLVDFVAYKGQLPTALWRLFPSFRDSEVEFGNRFFSCVFGVHCPTENSRFIRPETESYLGRSRAAEMPSTKASSRAPGRICPSPLGAGHPTIVRRASSS